MSHIAPPSRSHGRRAFLRRTLGAVGALFGLVGVAPGFLRAGERAEGGTAAPPGPTLRRGHGASIHPDPRPGIDGSEVLPAEHVREGVRDVFDGIRRIPHVADGIGCYCGCAAVPGMRSLLSCYEGMGMAEHCEICQGEGRTAVRMHDEGRDLAAIRAEIDRLYG